MKGNFTPWSYTLKTEVLYCKCSRKYIKIAPNQRKCPICSKKYWKYILYRFYKDNEKKHRPEGQRRLYKSSYSRYILNDQNKPDKD